MSKPLPSRARGLTLGACLVLAVALIAPTPALAAEPCPNEQLRVQDVWSSALPDCRAYEQVSPVDKGLTDAMGNVASVRGAPSGEAVTFAANTPFPGSGGSYAIPHFLSMRGAAGWSTRDLVPPTNPGSPADVTGVTEDLAYTLVTSFNEPALSPEAVEGRYSLYLQNSATGAYTLLAQAALGEVQEFYFVGAADGDSRIFFETADRLLPEAASGKPNVYEWHAERLSLVDVLPPAEGGDAPAGGAFAGPANHANGAGGVEYDFSVQGAVSEGGARVFFTDPETGRIYVREPQAGTTIAVSAGAGPAFWLAATPNGSQVLYTEGEGADANLYRFDVEDGQREALTSGAAGVLGVLGIGGEGAYVYFAAQGALAQGASEASGHANLYLLHEGTISFVAGLVEDEVNPYNWSALEGGVGAGSQEPSDYGRSSRVSADGRTLLFTDAGASPTGYASDGHVEIYLYSAASGRISCVSCNPSGAPASSNADLYLPVPGTHATRLDPGGIPRNLSADGERVFFQTAEALLPQDTNGVLDVYEWEQEGAGSCPSGGLGGCLYLISTGQNPEPSYFAEASASGNDVFFFTRQQLVGQDTDSNQDLYDARVGGGIPAQNLPVEQVAPCLGEACRPAQTPVPLLGVPVSQVFSGPGDIAAPAPAAVSTQPAKAKVKPKQTGKAKQRKKRGRKQRKSAARKAQGARVRHSRAARSSVDRHGMGGGR